jgi:hypothetical protein
VTETDIVGVKKIFANENVLRVSYIKKDGRLVTVEYDLETDDEVNKMLNPFLTYLVARMEGKF